MDIKYINMASANEIARIADISIKKAEEIVKFREKNGKFNSFEDLQNVPGIDKGLAQLIKEICEQCEANK